MEQRRVLASNASNHILSDHGEREIKQRYLRSLGIQLQEDGLAYSSRSAWLPSASPFPSFPEPLEFFFHPDLCSWWEENTFP